jgi:hypothetical protein
MALSDKTNLLVQKYVRRQYPELEEGLRRYLTDELQRIEVATASLANASIQVTDNPPENPVKGMVRFATTGWEPLGNGTTNFLVVYNGTAWVAV